MFKYIIGALIMAAGFGMIMKTEWMLSNFGRIGYFDEKLGAEGGSRLGYKLLGIAAIFIGLMLVTNTIGGFLNWVLSPLIRAHSGQGI